MPVRYKELSGSLEGWTYDEEGVMHTPSGYRCTAQQIEGMLWLLGRLLFNPEKC